MHRSHQTQSVHAGRGDLRDKGVHVPSIDRSTTYPLTSLSEAGEAMDRLMDGQAEATTSLYSRLHNPTVARFEQALAALEAADGAVAFGSGMAAMSAALLAARQHGRHVVAVRPLYGGTDHLLSSGLLDVEVTWARADEVAEALRADTALVVVETPANPTLRLTDIDQVVGQAGSVPVLVDSTFATPVLQQPLRHGAAMVLHSATKYLGGHGDVVAGVVAAGEAWAARLRQVRMVTGAVLDPRAAYDLHRGLQTLPLRVEAAQDNARALVGWLAEHPAVTRLHYPGWGDSDPSGLVGRQMRGGGAMIAFEVDGGLEAAGRVMAGVRLITPAVSLGSVDTLIQHPAGLTHRKVDPEVRAELGITDGLLRLSVGVEHAADLWEDLRAALDD